jgi:hypothetical protein
MRYYLLLALNKNYSGAPGLATGIAENALKKHPDADITDVNDMRLALLIFYLQYGDRSVFKLLVQFGHTDSWYEKKMGMDWAIKKKLVEVLLHIEYQNSELALSLLKSFRRRYKKYLAEVKEERVLTFLSILETFINKPEVITSAQFRVQVNQFIKSAQQGSDVFVISFLGWLKAKAEKKPVYDTILNLICNRNSPFGG